MNPKQLRKQIDKPNFYCQQLPLFIPERLHQELRSIADARGESIHQLISLWLNKAVESLKAKAGKPKPNGKEKSHGRTKNDQPKHPPQS